MPHPVRLVAAGIVLQACMLATNCRFVLADQSNWEAHQGFYREVESAPVGASTHCHIQNVVIAMGVADSRHWQFIVVNLAWQLNHNYTARAVITGYFDLYLDGRLLGHVPERFSGCRTSAFWQAPFLRGPTASRTFVECGSELGNDCRIIRSRSRSSEVRRQTHAVAIGSRDHGPALA